MNTILRTVASGAMGVALTAILASCASSTPPKGSSKDVTDFGKATRNDRLKYQVQDERERNLVQKAEELIEAGILYYNAQNFGKALEKFIPAKDLLGKASLDNPYVKQKLESAKAYLRKSAKRHSRQLYLFAERQFKSGTASVNLGMLNLAEKALLKARKLDPNIRDEVNALLRKVRKAKEDVLNKTNTANHVYPQDSMFGPSVYPGAKYWGLILVYAYC